MSTHGTGSKIPPALVEVLWEMSHGGINPASGGRWTDHDLAAWLKTAHGIVCSHDAVTRAMRPKRDAAAADAESLREYGKAMARARMARNLDPQMESLGDIAAKVATDARAAKPATRHKMLRALTQHAAVMLRYTIGDRLEVDADVGVEAKVTVTDARERVAERLAKLAAGAGRDRAT